MATPFSHTIHSINIDTHYLSLIGLSSTIILAILWGNWFLTAQITTYETSKKVYVTGKEIMPRHFSQNNNLGIREQITRQRIIVAEFSPESVKNIKEGQIAYIQLNSRIGRQTGSIPATVVDIQHIKGKDIVVLQAILDSTVPNPYEKGGGGEVKIEVGYVTPATVILNASGLLTDTAPLSSSSR